MEMLEKNKTTEMLYRIEQWDYERFSNTPPYYRNRFTERRIPKVIKNLEKKYLPTHSEVAVGLAVKPFECYNIGDYFILNGNARNEVFKIKPELIPPHPFNVTIYFCDNAEDTYALYCSFDSQDAAETSADKLTGLLRERNYTPYSKLITKGNFKSSIEMAVHFARENGFPLRKGTVEQKLDYLWKELTFLDQLNLDMKKASGSVIAAWLLICKKYGIDHPRIPIMIENFRNSITTVNNNTEIDGVHYVFSNLYEENKNEWPNVGWNTKKILMIKILIAFDLFINNKTVPKNKKGLWIEEKLKTFYVNYLNS